MRKEKIYEISAERACQPWVLTIPAQLEKSEDTFYSAVYIQLNTSIAPTGQSEDRLQRSLAFKRHTANRHFRRSSNIATD
jgi:hypothetical protein